MSESIYRCSSVKTNLKGHPFSAWNLIKPHQHQIFLFLTKTCRKTDGTTTDRLQKWIALTAGMNWDLHVSVNMKAFKSDLWKNKKLFLLNFSHWFVKFRNYQRSVFRHALYSQTKPSGNDSGVFPDRWGWLNHPASQHSFLYSSLRPLTAWTCFTLMKRLEPQW